MSDSTFWLIFGLIVMFGSITGTSLKSPCPDLFQYNSDNHHGEWTGTVTLLSDAELHGVWIRLIFDEKLSRLDVDDNFGAVVRSDDMRDFLVKNRNFLLKPSTPINFKITAKYEGDKIPNLVGYRLNAKTVCAANNVDSAHFFLGDLIDKDFLTSVEKVSDHMEFEGCGTAPLAQESELKIEKAQNGQWPWQAAIYIKQNNGEEYICEGTLISSKHIITAAHCVSYLKSGLAVLPQLLLVYLNKRDLNENNDVQKIGVGKIILYPGYRSGSLMNDVAIIQLEQPVIVNDNVRPICLGNLSSNRKEGFVVGYGINEDFKRQDLTQAKVKIEEEEGCPKHLRSFVTDNVFCATYVEGDPTWVGDSGSGLVALREGSKKIWELKGVVSVGVLLLDNEYSDNQPNALILVDMANYLKWIQEVIF